MEGGFTESPGSCDPDKRTLRRQFYCPAMSFSLIVKWTAEGAVKCIVVSEGLRAVFSKAEHSASMRQDFGINLCKVFCNEIAR